MATELVSRLRDYVNHTYDRTLRVEAADEIERLARAPVDGHCRKCTCDDCARFYYEHDRFPKHPDVTPNLSTTGE